LAVVDHAANVGIKHCHTSIEKVDSGALWWFKLVSTKLHNLGWVGAIGLIFNLSSSFFNFFSQTLYCWFVWKWLYAIEPLAP
jgi:hypothetical protein